MAVNLPSLHRGAIVLGPREHLAIKPFDRLIHEHDGIDDPPTALPQLLQLIIQTSWHNFGRKLFEMRYVVFPWSLTMYMVSVLWPPFRGWTRMRSPENSRTNALTR